jgi:replication-associated recombination protein RarA
VSGGAFRRLETVHGYQLDETVSSLQKAIRRSHIDEALYWATEMNQSGFAAYCYRRLMVIANEDIGIADHFAPVLVWSCYQMGMELHKKAPGTAEEKASRSWDPETLLHAVWYLAHAPKSRELNHAMSVIELRMERGERLEVPDYALDNHTARGRAMGRRQGFFQNEAAKLHPEADIDGNPWGKAWELERPQYTDEGGDRVQD